MFRLLISLSNKKWENPFEVIRKTALSLVQARRAEDRSLKHKDLLQLMIDATVEGEDGETRGFTDEEIAASSMSFLLAGYETTANTLAYASYLLALNPEIQDKLQAKIDEYFESNPEASIYDATQEVQYVDMVIQEALRMYPPAPRTTRHAQKTIEINGVTIPEGVSVLIPIQLFHYNPEYWTEPEKFDPERCCLPLNSYLPQIVVTIISPFLSSSGLLLKKRQSVLQSATCLLVGVLATALG